MFLFPWYVTSHSDILSIHDNWWSCWHNRHFFGTLPRMKVVYPVDLFRNFLDACRG